MRRVPILAALGLLALAPAAAAEPPLQWVAGDLHVHTTYSHDSYGGPGDDNTGPDEAYTLGHSVASQFALGRARAASTSWPSPTTTTCARSPTPASVPAG